MGLDLLDFTFRVERSFGIKVKPVDYECLPSRRPWDVTAGEMCGWVVGMCAN
jgi:hypothetical protein